MAQRMIHNTKHMPHYMPHTCNIAQAIPHPHRAEAAADHCTFYEQAPTQAHQHFLPAALLVKTGRTQRQKIEHFIQSFYHQILSMPCYYFPHTSPAVTWQASNGLHVEAYRSHSPGNKTRNIPQTSLLWGVAHALHQQDHTWMATTITYASTFPSFISDH